MSQLEAKELAELAERVFGPSADERRIAVLVDLPDGSTADTAAWAERREMAAGWVRALDGYEGFEVSLCLYRNVRANNADLPERAWIIARQKLKAGQLPATADELAADEAEPMEGIFKGYPLMLAPTQFSATAPLKVAARQHRFRAATMPGFSAAMIPALRLDYVEINRRVGHLKDLLDRATAALLKFVVDGQTEHRLTLDLRHRTAHASGGVLREPGTAGNLPSGEAYTVPYEGELAGVPSGSEGTLPVQLGDEVVVYKIENNRAVAVVDGGERAKQEAAKLKAEPAYANLAELGLGVLGDFGVEPIGELLLDEKLGLHIAFGRSEHFGGRVGPSDFSRPEAVVHIDRVYLPSMQPRVKVVAAELVTPIPFIGIAQTK